MGMEYIPLSNITNTYPNIRKYRTVGATPSADDLLNAAIAERDIELGLSSISPIQAAPTTQINIGL
jgi:hypothetical protein